MSAELRELEADCHRWALDLDASLDPAGSVSTYLRRRAPLLDGDEHADAVQRVLDRLVGLGPLEPLLALEGVTEVMVNGPGPISVEQNGQLHRTDIEIDRPTIDHLGERVIAPLGRRLDRSSPMADGRLADGSRVHVAAPPIAIDGPYITVRRFRVRPVELEEFGDLETVELLRWAVDARCNILISGGTNTGKTTLLNALARLIPSGERLISIEDAAELRLGARHVVRLEARPASVDGPAPVPIRELVRNALRMRPDRIIVGEVRGDEALDMVQAMNTGHEGSFSTCHANGPADAVARLTSMIVMEGSISSVSAARELVVAAIDLVVHLGRAASQDRQVVAVAGPGPDGAMCDLVGAGGRFQAPSRAPRRHGASAGGRVSNSPDERLAP